MNGCRILVTGGTGFVGQALCQHLAGAGCQVRLPVRNATYENFADGSTIVTGDLEHFTSWRELVRGVDAIVHLVARTHVTDEFGTTALAAYRATNVEITRRLAVAAKQERVRRFVYLSSIKAVANESSTPLTEASNCHPVDSYGITKREAEQTVRRQLLGSGTAYTILRPPLVYGPWVKGNFLRLLHLVQRGVPLPGIRNRRSMVHVQNLVDVIALCLEHPAALDQTFHVADPTAISTSDLIRHMATGLDTPARLVPLPPFLLKQLGRMTGRSEEIRRLVDSLVVSTEVLRARLNWNPRVDTPQGIAQTSRQYALAPWSASTQPPAPTELPRAA